MTGKLKKVLLPNLPYLLFVWLFDKLCQAVRLAPGLDASEKLLRIAQGFTEAFASLWLSLHPLDLLLGVAGAALVRLAVYLKAKNAKKYRRGVEYGSARWGRPEDIAPYIDPVPDWNIPLTRTESLTMTSRPKNPKTARNKNILVIGGSGSGKTRFFVKPSLLQMHSSYVVTDPKGQLLRETGKLLAHGGPKRDENGKPVRDKHGKVVYEPYRIKVLNTINFSKSMKYNPLAYVRSEKDILKLVNVIIANTKGDGEKSSEDFWIKAERLLYCALIGYIWYEAEPEEKNFITLLELINACEAREDDETYKSPVDILFDELAQAQPEHFAVKQYVKFKMAAGVVCSKRLLNRLIKKSFRAYNTRRQLVFAVLLDRKVVRVAGFQLIEHNIHGVLEGLIVLSGFRGIDHFEQGSKVFLVVGCLVPDVTDEGCIVQLFRLHPKIFAGFIAISLRVDDDRIDQLEDVLLAADVAERVVVHGFFEIDGVQRLDDVAALFKHFAALHQHRTLRIGHNIAAVHLHQIGFDKKSRFT